MRYSPHDKKMKEVYYTKETIKSQSLSFKNELKYFSPQKKTNIIPDKAVLLILDMQNFFLDKSSHAFVPSAEAIIPQIKQVGKMVLDSKGSILYTRHINTKENAQNMGTWWRDILVESDALSEIRTDIYMKNAPIIKKSQYDAFYNTNLEEQLRNANKCQIIISGVMTHLCCETTARSAFIRGFDVFFGIDLTATYNRRFHSSTLLNLSHGFAVPILSDEIKKNFI